MYDEDEKEVGDDEKGFGADDFDPDADLDEPGDADLGRIHVDDEDEYESRFT